MLDIVNFVASEPKIVSFACSGFQGTTALIDFAKMLKSNTSLIDLSADIDDPEFDPEKDTGAYEAQQYIEHCFIENKFADKVPVMEAIFKYCMDSDVAVLKEHAEMYAERDKDSLWWRQIQKEEEHEEESEDEE